MTSKFNKEMYDKIKGKKNEPLSSIGQKRLRITDKEKEKEVVERGSSTPTLDLDEGLVASPGISIEEVARPSKRQKAASKGKGKVDASVWSDAGTAMDRATGLFTPGEMREVTSIPSHEMVSRHVHKLVQVNLYIPYPFLRFYLPDHFRFIELIFTNSVFVHRCWGRPCTSPLSI